MVYGLTAGLGVISMALGASDGSAEPPQVEYLSDIVYGVSTYRLDYTRVMGVDTTSYPLWPQPIPGAPLKIKDQAYAKGIGAPYGEILVMLDGDYETFAAEVGIQAGTTGSAVFQVFVDGQLRFDSGLMSENDEARPVQVSVAGAQEMRLMAGGAGQSNWAGARLTRAASPAPVEPVDMAPFARVATWDPARLDGVRVNRLTEFPAEDVFLEQELKPARGGTYIVPVAANGEGCIGLQWLERRRLREIGLQFADPASRPAPDGVRVEGWVLKDPLALDGFSEWQGRWTALQGQIEPQGDQWIFHFQSKDNREVSEGTYKIRWIFPTTPQPIKVRRFTALTTSRWNTAELLLQMENPEAGQRGEVEVYNGEIIAAIHNPPGESANNANRREFSTLIRENSRRLVDQSLKSEIRNPKSEIALSGTCRNRCG